MKISRHIALAAIVGTLGIAAGPAPASANGAASTRNILLGGAAAAAGTLLIVNHNKKVHQKYDEYDRRQAQTQASADSAQAAYESEKRAYAREAALASAYRREIAQQHAAVRERDARIAALTNSLRIAKANGRTHAVAFVRPVDRVQVVRLAAARQPVVAPRATRQAPASRDVSYGWGSY